MATIVIDRDYGYVILAAVGSFALNFWQTLRIGSKRKEYDIKYPQMYSDKHQDFNCYQRAHQNTLEQVPFFLSTILLAGTRFPCYAATCGAIWLVGRIGYTIGYSTGNPSSRMPGAMISMLLGQFPLFGMAVAAGCGLLGWF